MYISIKNSGTVILIPCNHPIFEILSLSKIFTKHINITNQSLSQNKFFILCLEKKYTQSNLM